MKFNVSSWKVSVLNDPVIHIREQLWNPSFSNWNPEKSIFKNQTSVNTYDSIQKAYKTNYPRCLRLIAIRKMIHQGGSFGKISQNSMGFSRFPGVSEPKYNAGQLWHAENSNECACVYANRQLYGHIIYYNSHRSLTQNSDISIWRLLIG